MVVQKGYNLRKEIREISKRIDSEEAAQNKPRTYARAMSALVDQASHRPEVEQEGKYWQARRCLRVWPMKGKKIRNMDKHRYLPE